LGENHGYFFLLICYLHLFFLVFSIVKSHTDGVILEQYAEDSCLVGGFTTEGKPVHVVCGRRGESLVVITVYVPKPPKFKNPWERG
jgi:hypothetical protein